MKKILTNKMLIFSIVLTFGIAFSNCGKKKSGLLLLPELTQGQGGPQISPDNPKTAAEEKPTTQQNPSIEVTDDIGMTDTGNTGNDNSGNTGNTGNDNSNNSGDNNGGVVYLGPPEQDSGSTGNTGDNNTGNTGNDNSGNTGNTGDNNTGNTGNDNSGSIHEPQPPQPADDTGDDAVNDPNEGSDNDQTPVPGNDDDQGSSDNQDDGDIILPPTEDEQPGDGNNQNCKAKVIKIDTSQGKWYNTVEEIILPPKKIPAVLDKVNVETKKASVEVQKSQVEKEIQPPHPIKPIKVKGIHTYWAYQNLLVTVNSNCEGGKYRLVIVAKNIHGPLPEWYHYFVVKVVNQNSGETLGIMKIRASDNHYYRGRLDIKLNKGENVLNILWTNDAWEPNKYDANIQIKRIFIRKIPAQPKKQILARNGNDFCDANGRWFVDADRSTAYTYWANQTLSYCFRTKKSGKYEIVIRGGNAKNGWPLMPEYKEFKLLVAANGKSNYITIPAEQGKYNRGVTTLDLPEGDVVLNVTWLNDLWQPDRGYDANIEVVKVRIKRVGEADSPISAFLLQNPNITYKVLIPSTILVLGILGMIYWFKRKEEIA